jgi:hypothetical protein
LLQENIWLSIPPPAIICFQAINHFILLISQLSKKSILADGFNIPFLPYYRRYLEKECNCDMADFPSFWDYLRIKNEEVVVVSSLDRMEILTNYMNIVHSYNLPVKEDLSDRLLQLQKSDARGDLTNLKIYTLDR